MKDWRLTLKYKNMKEKWNGNRCEETKKKKKNEEEIEEKRKNEEKCWKM